ncbi:MAG: hypothetical protein LHV69_03745 [Elusimicrobia bacterium]|nr:hypothetical protein [Candidatus Obscuribacterium magneticum]
MSIDSLFDWIKSNKKSAAGGEPRPAPVDWKEKRKHNRVYFDPQESLSLHILSPEKGEKASTLRAGVKNIGLRGGWLVFESKEDQQKIKAGDVVVASLVIDDFSIPLTLEVLRVMGDREAAIKFKPPFPRELALLEKFLEPHCLGMSLREIDESALQKETGKGLRWFQGVNDTHLFSWYQPATGEIVQQQLLFLGNVLEWKKDGSLHSGKVRPEALSVHASYGWVEAELMDFDGSLDKRIARQGRVIIEASNVSSDVKNIFLSKLK